MKKVRTDKPQNINIVKNQKEPNTTEHLYFLFNRFHLNSIKIESRFNNHYKDKDEYMRKISIMFGKALPLLSNETKEIFLDVHKAKVFHLHHIRGKQDILYEILKTYNFSDNDINNMFEGDKIFQLEMPYENGASRIIFEQIDNVISFLFMDPNHHIYFDAKKVNAARSLFYEECPVNNIKNCSQMSSFNTCFVPDFLDWNKINETYGYNFSE